MSERACEWICPGHGGEVHRAALLDSSVRDMYVAPQCIGGLRLRLNRVLWWEDDEGVRHHDAPVVSPTPEPDRCPTCGSDDRTRVRAGCEYWKDDTLAHPWHQGADR